MIFSPTIFYPLLITAASATPIDTRGDSGFIFNHWKRTSILLSPDNNCEGYGNRCSVTGPGLCCGWQNQLYSSVQTPSRWDVIYAGSLQRGNPCGVVLGGDPSCFGDSGLDTISGAAFGIPPVANELSVMGDNTTSTPSFPIYTIHSGPGDYAVKRGDKLYAVVEGSDNWKIVHAMVQKDPKDPEIKDTIVRLADDVEDGW